MKPSNFQFTDPSLTYIKFIENSGFDMKEDEEIQIDAKIDLKNKKLSDNEYIVSTILKIGKEDNTSPFLIEAEMTAKFRWNGEALKPETEELYLSQNAPALLISYLRPIIALVTNASNYPAYNLPFINFVK